MDKLLKRYFVDAPGAMALGLFTSLIIGLILQQLSKLPYCDFLSIANTVLSAKSPVIGAAIGVAISYSLQSPPLVLFASCATGAFGYMAGGPVGAYLSALAGAEIGSLVSGRTPFDILITPALTIIIGMFIGKWVGPYIHDFMLYLGSVINHATELNPFFMGIIVSVVVGMALTMPISSAALCIMLNLDGLAAGAATVGCCSQMVGFAVISFRDNGFQGLLSQGLGTSMLQIPNIICRPQIWIAPILTSALLGPLSTIVFKMTNTAIGAGMGTSGLVGQITTFIQMKGSMSDTYLIILILGLQIILPGILAFAIDSVIRRQGWVRNGDMKLSV
ncbi:MAG: PTS transporter subunit IIC [Bacteroidales bacterium]